MFIYSVSVCSVCDAALRQRAGNTFAGVTLLLHHMALRDQTHQNYQ